MSKKLCYQYDKEIRKKNEENPKYYKQNFSKHSRNTILENEYDQDFKGIKQTNLLSKENRVNLEPKIAQKSFNDNNNNNDLLNKLEFLENQIKDAKTEIVNEIKSLGTIFQKSFESFSKSIIEIIQGKTSMKQEDKNDDKQSFSKHSKEKNILNKKNNALQNSLLNKNEKFDLENNELIYYTYSEKRKSNYDKSEIVLKKRKLFNNSNSSENNKEQVQNNGSANFSFSFENGSRKEHSQEVSSKNANKEIENSIRRKYKRKKEELNKQ